MATNIQSSISEEIDVFLIPTRAWDNWKSGSYQILTDDNIQIKTWDILPIEYCSFRTRSQNKLTFAFAIQAKRIDYTAIITESILTYFCSLIENDERKYKVDRMIMIGFCGTLKSDEFKLGDIGVACQIDCYMEKAKLAEVQRIELSGEVYKPTLEFIRLTQNLKHLDPDGYKTFIVLVK